METNNPLQTVDNIENERDTTQTEVQPFTDEAISALKEFCEVLQEIHNRLVSEGKTPEIDPHYVHQPDHT